MLSWFKVLLFACLLLAGGIAVFAQPPDPPKIPGQKEEDQPQTIQETLIKMRIDKDKKDHEQMVTRGEEALKIAEQIEKDYDAKGQLSADDLSKIANVEKLVKKIRTELGGADDGENQEDPNEPRISTRSDAVRSLRQTAEAMFNELKKNTRFSISLSAIQTTNAMLRLAKFLRGN